MKRSTFILVGMLLTVLAIGMVSCGSPSQQNAEAEQGMAIDKSPLGNALANTMVVNYSSQTKPVSIQQLAYTQNIEVHEVKYKGKTLLVISDYNTGLAIYDMTEPTELVSMAEPSKESLESLTNPEVRPVPVGS
tara:strand:+ start:136 stop:537 length:402 start_codon:yes stop_codon:yes gene_type:complete